MSNFTALDIFLHDQLIGTLTHLPGDKNLLSFREIVNVINEHLKTLPIVSET